MTTYEQWKENIELRAQYKLIPLSPTEHGRVALEIKLASNLGIRLTPTDVAFYDNVMANAARTAPNGRVFYTREQCEAWSRGDRQTDPPTDVSVILLNPHFELGEKSQFKLVPNTPRAIQMFADKMDCCRRADGTYVTRGLDLTQRMVQVLKNFGFTCVMEDESEEETK